MKRQLWNAGLLIAFATSLTPSENARAQYAAAVVSYDAGATAVAGFTTPLAALGAPARITGTAPFEGAVTPFNPPYLAGQIVSVGEGGQLTLRLSNYVIPQVVGPEIGVFTNAGLADIAYPDGQAGNLSSTEQIDANTFGIDSALIDVSENGVDWVSLSTRRFDIPTNGYADLTDPFSPSAGSVPSDFQQPFTGSLGDFSGLKYSDAGGPDIQELLAGSGGGTWLDISGTGLAQVGYIRFSVAPDLSPTINVNFELDAVSIAHAALGSATVPEPATLILCGLALLLPAILLRQRARRAE